jgi:hypothetical protein
MSSAGKALGAACVTVQPKSFSSGIPNLRRVPRRSYRESSSRSVERNAAMRTVPARPCCP